MSQRVRAIRLLASAGLAAGAILLLVGCTLPQQVWSPVTLGPDSSELPRTVQSLLRSDEGEPLPSSSVGDDCSCVAASDPEAPTTPPQFQP